MLFVGFTTPYRILLLVLTKRLCYDHYPEQYISKFVILITRHILDEISVQRNCSEPTLRDVYNEIGGFSEDQTDIQPVIDAIHEEVVFISEMWRLDQFMSDIKILIDEQEAYRDDIVILDRCSVMGLFFRKCRIAFQSLSFSQLSDVHKAYNLYINGVVGDTGYFIHNENDDDKNPDMWVSDYNVEEFLKYQAEQIEKYGTCSFDSTTLHYFLVKAEEQLPNISSIRHVRYLNYTRTKEYMLSLSHCHMYFDLSLQDGIEIQYSLLNLGILEYKFGHNFNALSALNDALSAARSNKDEYCLQEVQYWIETCRKNHTFNSNSSFTDEYLANMKTLTEARNLLRNGGQGRYVFEALYKSSIRIIMSNVKEMHRSQFLTTSLAWLRYGNSAMAETYLLLAEKIGERSVDDIERTAVTHLKMLMERGESSDVIEEITNFGDWFPHEQEFLIYWRQARARMLQRSTKKRKLTLIERQEDKLEFATPPYTDEYFDIVHNNALNLILNKEFEKALLVLDETQDFIRKTDYTAQLGYNLILQAEAHIQMQSLNTAVPLLIEAMTLCKRLCDINNYYSATIKLTQAYTRMNDKKLLEKSIFMLESIFPKVLLMRSKVQNSNLYLAYAEALSMDSLTIKQDEIREYVENAEQGYRELGLKHQLLRALHFKAMLMEKLKLFHLRDQTLGDIRNIQKS